MISPLLWTTAVTGRGPDEHGVADFVVEGADGKAAPISSAFRKAPALWEILTAAGQGSGFVNFWATQPPEAIDGVLVSDVADRLLSEPDRKLPLPAGLAAPRSFLDDQVGEMYTTDTLPVGPDSRLRPGAHGRGDRRGATLLARAGAAGRMESRPPRGFRSEDADPGLPAQERHARREPGADDAGPARGPRPGNGRRLLPRAGRGGAQLPAPRAAAAPPGPRRRAGALLRRRGELLPGARRRRRPPGRRRRSGHRGHPPLRPRLPLGGPPPDRRGAVRAGAAGRMAPAARGLPRRRRTGAAQRGRSAAHHVRDHADDPRAAGRATRRVDAGPGAGRPARARGRRPPARAADPVVGGARSPAPVRGRVGGGSRGGPAADGRSAARTRLRR